jgi:hypothetical protein
MNHGRVMGSISHLLFVNVNMKWSDNVLKDRKFLPHAPTAHRARRSAMLRSSQNCYDKYLAAC